MTNPYYVEPAGQALSGLGSAIAGKMIQKREAEEKEALQMKNKALVGEAQGLLAGNDIGKLQDFMLANPAMGKRIDSVMNFKDDKTRANATETGFKIMSGSDPKAAIMARAEFIKQNDGDPTQTLQMLEAGPKEQENWAKFLLAQNASKDQLSALNDINNSGMTEYQRATVDLKTRAASARELEIKVRQEQDANKKKKLQNELKMQKIKLDKAEREAAAEAAGGNAMKLLKSSTESARGASSFARRMVDSALVLDGFEGALGEDGLPSFDPTGRLITSIAGGSGMVSELANKMASKEEQQYASAASDFVTAQLRDESGASIGTEEFERKYREFFPVPGDTKEQIASKRVRRNAAANDMINLSAGLYDALYASPEVIEEAAVVEPPAIESTGEAPPQALEYLRSNPRMAFQFKEKYGYLPEGY